MAAKKNQWLEEFYNLIQSFTRSMVFGISLIYTMETWWLGNYLAYGKLVGFFFLTFLVDLYLIPLTSGKSEMKIGEIIRHSVRNKGMSILSSAIILLTLNIISPFQPSFERDAATVLLLSIPVSIGADVAQILNIFNQRSQKKENKTGKGQERNPWKFLRNDIASTSGGALFVCLPVAPTQEIPLLATRMRFMEEIALIALSLLLSYIIVFTSGMSQTPPSGDGGPWVKIWPVTETMLSYVVSLVVALLILALFGRITLDTTVAQALSLMVVLGLPATIGGAAGRLVL